MSASWASALARYERTTQIAAAIDGDKNEPAFDAAASQQGEAIELLLHVPAPDLRAVAIKLQIIHRDGYQHMLAPVLADVERLDGHTREPEAPWGGWIGKAYVFPSAFPNVSEPMARAFERVRGAYFSGEEGAGDSFTAASAAVADVPARSSADLAAKIMLGLFEVGPSHVGNRLAVLSSDLPTTNVAAILLSAASDARRIAGREL